MAQQDAQSYAFRAVLRFSDGRPEPCPLDPAGVRAGTVTVFRAHPILPAANSPEARKAVTVPIGPHRPNSLALR
jgi:hypothetical protein